MKNYIIFIDKRRKQNITADGWNIVDGDVIFRIFNKGIAVFHMNNIIGFMEI